MSRKAVYLLMVICALISCYDEEIDMGEMQAGKATLNLEAARAYFEQHATGLNTLSFERQGLSRSSALLEINTPLWSEAEVSTTPQSVVVEVPILSDGETWVYKSRMENGEQVGESCFVFKKLVVSQRDNGHMNMFVVTFVPDVFTPVEAYSLEGSFIRYYGGTFSGLLFCSDLEGNLKQCFKYRDGVNLGTVRLAYKSELEEAGVEFGEEDEFLCFGRMMASRSYGDDETGGGNLGVCPHGGNPLTCEICNSLVIVPHYCPGGCGKDLDWESCACCFVCRVTPCVCIKCDVCGRATWDCVCATCSICNQKPCLDVCSECHERYCHGQCHQSPGSGGVVVGEEPDTLALGNIDDFMNKYMTTSRMQNSLNALGLTDEHLKQVNYAFKSMSPNARYNSLTNLFEVSAEIFNRGFTDVEIEAILYHEFVHVKQDIVDKIVIERDESGIFVSDLYECEISEQVLENRLESFYLEMSRLDVPLDAEQRTTEQQEAWEKYYDAMYLFYEREKDAGNNYYFTVNKNLVETEYEAYSLMLDEYKNEMSSTFKKDNEYMLTRNKLTKELIEMSHLAEEN